MRRIAISFLFFFAFFVPPVTAQAPVATSQSALSPAVSTVEVPRLIKFSGTLLDAQEQPLAGPVGVTFALYAQQTGGAALWMETQNVKPEANGVYTVLLGANNTNGVPAELFTSTEARWLGIQVGQQPENERILLVSVPYALKAGDAETLGGKPLSSFLLAPPEATTSTGSSGGTAATGTVAASSSGTTPKSTSPKPSLSGTGTMNYIPLFTDNAGTLGNSTITQVNGNVGIGVMAPSNTALAIFVPPGKAAMNMSNFTDQDMIVSLSSPGASDKVGFIGSSTPTNLVLGVGGYEKVRVTNAGNVGIGYNNPASRLVIGAPAGGGVLNASNLTDQDMLITLSGPGASDKKTYFGPSTNTNLTLGVGGVEKMRITNAGNIGIGTATPSNLLSLGGQAPASLGMDPNPAAGTAGNALTVTAGSAAAGATDLAGGDLILTAGDGTGLGGSGNARIQTAGANDTSGTTGDTLSDRQIVVGKAKAMTLSTPGFTSLMSIHLVGTHTAGGRIRYMVRATDGGSQIATEEGVIQYLATANSITCTVQTNDKLHLGTVNSGCTPGFFNPGSQPGVSIFDNVSFFSPAPIVVHEVYFTIENESGAPIRLEP
jgi:hypothetical protein